jgi:hypothetical protein
VPFFLLPGFLGILDHAYVAGPEGKGHTYKVLVQSKAHAEENPRLAFEACQLLFMTTKHVGWPPSTIFPPPQKNTHPTIAGT